MGGTLGFFKSNHIKKRFGVINTKAQAQAIWDDEILPQLRADPNAKIGLLYSANYDQAESIWKSQRLKNGKSQTITGIISGAGQAPLSKQLSILITNNEKHFPNLRQRVHIIPIATCIASGGKKMVDREKISLCLIRLAKHLGAGFNVLSLSNNGHFAIGGRTVANWGNIDDQSARVRRVVNNGIGGRSVTNSLVAGMEGLQWQVVTSPSGRTEYDAISKGEFVEEILQRARLYLAHSDSDNLLTAPEGLFPDFFLHSYAVGKGIITQEGQLNRVNCPELYASKRPYAEFLPKSKGRKAGEPAHEVLSHDEIDDILDDVDQLQAAASGAGAAAVPVDPVVEQQLQVLQELPVARLEDDDEDADAATLVGDEFEQNGGAGPAEPLGRIVVNADYGTLKSKKGQEGIEESLAKYIYAIGNVTRKEDQSGSEYAKFGAPGPRPRARSTPNVHARSAEKSTPEWDEILETYEKIIQALTLLPKAQALIIQHIKTTRKEAEVERRYASVEKFIRLVSEQVSNLKHMESQDARKTLVGYFDEVLQNLQKLANSYGLSQNTKDSIRISLGLLAADNIEAEGDRLEAADAEQEVDENSDEEDDDEEADFDDEEDEDLDLEGADEELGQLGQLDPLRIQLEGMVDAIWFSDDEKKEAIKATIGLAIQNKDEYPDGLKLLPRDLQDEIAEKRNELEDNDLLELLGEFSNSLQELAISFGGPASVAEENGDDAAQMAGAAEDADIEDDEEDEEDEEDEVDEELGPGEEEAAEEALLPHMVEPVERIREFDALGHTIFRENLERGEQTKAWVNWDEARQDPTSLIDMAALPSDDNNQFVSHSDEVETEFLPDRADPSKFQDCYRNLSDFTFTHIDAQFGIKTSVDRVNNRVIRDAREQEKHLPKEKRIDFDHVYMQFDLVLTRAVAMVRSIDFDLQYRENEAAGEEEKSSYQSARRTLYNSLKRLHQDLVKVQGSPSHKDYARVETEFNDTLVRFLHANKLDKGCTTLKDYEFLLLYYRHHSVSIDPAMEIRTLSKVNDQYTLLKKAIPITKKGLFDKEDFDNSTAKKIEAFREVDEAFAKRMQTDDSAINPQLRRKWGMRAAPKNAFVQTSSLIPVPGSAAEGAERGAPRALQVSNFISITSGTVPGFVGEHDSLEMVKKNIRQTYDNAKEVIAAEIKAQTGMDMTDDCDFQIEIVTLNSDFPVDGPGTQNQHKIVTRTHDAVKELRHETDDRDNPTGLNGKVGYNYRPVDNARFLSGEHLSYGGRRAVSNNSTPAYFNRTHAYHRAAAVGQAQYTVSVNAAGAIDKVVVPLYSCASGVNRTQLTKTQADIIHHANNLPEGTTAGEVQTAMLDSFHEPALNGWMNPGAHSVNPNSKPANLLPGSEGIYTAKAGAKNRSLSLSPLKTIFGDSLSTQAARQVEEEYKFALARLETVANDVPPADPATPDNVEHYLVSAAKNVINEVKAAKANAKPKEVAMLTEALNATRQVLTRNREPARDRVTRSALKLQRHSSKFKRVAGALLLVAGVALIAASIAAFAYSAGTSTAGALLGVGMVSTALGVLGLHKSRKQTKLDESLEAFRTEAFNKPRSKGA